MVPAGATALDVDDDFPLGHLGRDLDDGFDLVNRARLEHHVADANGVELLDKLDGLVQVGDAGGHDHAVDGGTRLTSFLDQPLATHLQLPQVGIEEQRVELHGAARLQERDQLRDASVEDLFGYLAATSQLGPVAGVGRGGNDLGVHRGRGHTREKDRRPSGEPGELGGRLDRTIGQLDYRGRVAGPGRGDRRGGTHGEQAALAGPGGGRDDADTETTNHRGG